MDVPLGQLNITSLKIIKILIASHECAARSTQYHFIKNFKNFKNISTSDDKLSLQFHQKSIAPMCAYQWLPPGGEPLDRL